MTNIFFVTGIGTDVGKTIVSAIITEAFQADYWKPVQAGFDSGTDAAFVQSIISNQQTKIYPETYKLKMPVSPHIAAKEEGIKIDLDKIYNDFEKFCQLSTANHQHTLIIEGAGGLFAPLNEYEFIIDLIKKLNAKVALVSRNYLGSINHSLLTAQVCRQHNLDVLGWIFNDQYLNYENEIVQWSGYKKLASIPLKKTIDKNFILEQAAILKNSF